MRLLCIYLPTKQKLHLLMYLLIMDGELTEGP